MGPARASARTTRNYALAESTTCTTALGYPVWGLSPASTPDDTGGYDAYGAHQLGSNRGCCPYDETAVTPHAVVPRADRARRTRRTPTSRRCASQYRAVYGPYGFYDSLNPITGSVTHRYLVLDQSMIMAALDEVLDTAG